MALKLCIYLLFCTYHLVWAARDPCETRETCSECITYPNCVWCAKVDAGKKCITNSSDIQSKCQGYLQYKESVVATKENENFTSSTENVVQLKPQRIKIDLKVGEPTRFDFAFKQAVNYPVDLYFLLDASSSMSKVRNTLKNQSTEIYNVIHKFTDSIRLGIGTFVDKNAMPFVQDPNKQEVYSYKHLLDFTKDLTTFNNALEEINFTKNFDAPEGGLDALAQVLACSEDSQNIIKWNKHSRKFVLFITDDEFHVAGDGALAGILQPYDEKCYTTADGKYTKELEMDYPTVSNIYKLAKRIEAILVFIVEENTESIYWNLSRYLGGIIKTYKNHGNEELITDSFVNKLREAYEDKTKHVKLKTIIHGDISQDSLRIDFTPDCSEFNVENSLQEDDKNTCEIQDNKEIHISGTIKLETYNEASKTFSVDIVVNGINEKLTLDVNVITNCDCESASTANAAECSNNGTLVCGLCKCNENRYGAKCKCMKPNEDTDLSLCKMNTDDGDDKVCSGNGKCECGECKCDSLGDEQSYTGRFCQCDANSCPIGPNGKQCSGHGKCSCGLCICENVWEGDNCEISRLKTNCMKENQQCNGRGTCFNNRCVCQKAPAWDARQSFDEYCSILPKTEQNQCKLLENHARCAYDKKDDCPDSNSVKLNLTKDISDSEKKTMNLCDDVRVSPGCYIQFGYKYNDDDRTVQLLVEEKADCQENYYMTGGGVLAALIIIVMTTLIVWKIIITRRDRKEYEQFMFSRNLQSSIRKNVLYTSPETTITNPAYETKCD